MALRPAGPGSVWKGRCLSAGVWRSVPFVCCVLLPDSRSLPPGIPRCCCCCCCRCYRAYRCCCCCCLQSPNPTDLGRREEAHNCLQSPNPTDFGRREEAHTCTLALNRLRALIDTNSNLAMCRKNWRCATNRRGATNRRLPSSIPMLYVSLTCRLILSLLPLLYLLNLSQMSNISVWRCAAKTGDVPQTGEVPQTGDYHHQFRCSMYPSLVV